MLNSASEAPLCSQQTHNNQGLVLFSAKEATSPKLNQPDSSQPSTEVRTHQANIFFCHVLFQYFCTSLRFVGFGST